MKNRAPFYFLIAFAPLMLRAAVSVSGVIAILILPLSPAAAQSPAVDQSTVDYCVRCVVPQATHVCSVTVESGVVSIGEWQAFCAAQLAYDAGHGQCQATPGVETCDADQRYSYHSTPDQGIVAVQSDPGQLGLRPGGMFEGAAEYVRRTSVDVGEALGDGVSAVGRTVRDGADVVGEGASAVGRSVREGASSVGETAGEVGRGVVRGARDVGDGVTRGVGCVFTLGRQC